MLGFVTDPTGSGGLRLTDDLPEPDPAAGEVVVEVRAYAINHDEVNLIARRPDGWRPGQDVAGVVVRALRVGGAVLGRNVLITAATGGWASSRCNSRSPRGLG